MTPARRAHYLRANRAERLPRRIACLDSEALIEREGPLERHRLRCAFASFDELDESGAPLGPPAQLASLEPLELWTWLETRAGRRGRTVLFAHNLAYDLRLTRALELLPELGWELRGFALDRHRAWLRFRKGERSLSLVDTVSFVGRSLAHFADALGRTRPALPGERAPLSAWVERCRSDTLLLRELVLRLLSFLRESECGDFRLTGPAQGSAAFRHRFLPARTLLCHDDAEQLERERRSAWAGRCEVWRHGQVEGPLHEWDYTAAYARLARDAKLPCHYRGELCPASLERLERLPDRFAYLAEVEVELETPLLPAEHAGAILWPVGRFRTLAWDCELELAREHGARLEVGRAWVYRRAPLLAEWGAWIVAELERPAGELCPVARACLKLWSRSLIGRFGLRYPDWRQLAQAESSALELISTVSAETGKRGAWLRIGEQVLELTGTVESPDSAPAVMGYVMALARVRLWRAIEAAGQDSLVYLDTDSLIVDEAGSRRLAQFARTPAGEGLRRKGRYGGGHFYGPRQLELPGEHRIAGLPRSAVPQDEGVWRAAFWQSAAHSLRVGEPGSVRVTERSFQIRAQDARRAHLAGGATAPRVVGRGKRQSGSCGLDASESEAALGR